MSGKKRILLGDDEVHISKLTKVRLEHEGYEVVTAHDGEEVIQKAKAGLPIHCILLDVWMPKRNGYEVCRFLKKDSKTASVPVIIFTASEAEHKSLADRCIEAGAAGWIRKPFRAQELIRMIADAVSNGGRDNE